MEYIKAEMAGLTAERVLDYIYYMIEAKEVSVSYITQAVCALKVVYNELLKAGVTIDFPKMKKEKRLPDILLWYNLTQVSQVDTSWFSY